jgi:hypothetical protein
MKAISVKADMNDSNCSKLETVHCFTSINNTNGLYSDCNDYIFTVVLNVSKV